MRQSTEIMIQLIKDELYQNKSESLRNSVYDGKTLVDILILSRKHGVSQIVASALLNAGVLKNTPQECLFVDELYSSVYIYEKTKSLYDKICSVLEDNKICYIPLKGTVIRNLYPEPWMRISCDIDILVKKRDIRKAINLFTESCDLVVKSKTKHDVTLASVDGIRLELHFGLLSDKRSPLNSKLASKVWEYAEPVSDNRSEYKMSDSYFYYYHILHMAKHFRIGGCGLRPFVDLSLIIHSNKFNVDNSDRLLKIGKVADFELYARNLCEVWFGEKVHNDITTAMQEYIIEGGSFGSEKTRIIANRQQYKHKYKYLLSRMFVDRDYLKSDYPILEKSLLFLPFCIIARFFSFVFGRKKDFATRQMLKINDLNNNIDIESGLFKKLGI